MNPNDLYDKHNRVKRNIRRENDLRNDLRNQSLIGKSRHRIHEPSVSLGVHIQQKNTGSNPGMDFLKTVDGKEFFVWKKL